MVILLKWLIKIDSYNSKQKVLLICIVIQLLKTKDFTLDKNLRI